MKEVDHEAAAVHFDAKFNFYDVCCRLKKLFTVFSVAQIALLYITKFGFIVFLCIYFKITCLFFFIFYK